MTIDELASHWRCSSRQVMRLIDAGRLSAIDIGIGSRRKLVVSLDEVQRFEENSEPKRIKAKPRPKCVPEWIK